MSEECFNKIAIGLEEALDYAKKENETLSESNIKDQAGFKAFAQALMIQYWTASTMEQEHVKQMWASQSDAEKIESKKLAKTVLMNALVDLTKVM